MMSKRLTYIVIISLVLLASATGASFLLFQDRAAKTSLAANCYTVTPAAFGPIFGGTIFHRGLNYLYIADSNIGDSDVFLAELNLPEGATIRQIQAQYKDNGSDNGKCLATVGG